MMKHMMAFILIVMCLTVPSFVFAHGNALHILGTVTEAAQGKIVVTTPKGESVTLLIQEKTIFQLDGITTNTARPVVGDRIVAEAEKEAGHLVAHEVRFATPKTK
ncbi:MAG: hypothetical protein MRJ67_01780 [Nitrospirales bacterium]|nr:hypothetical protein [Nitrospira sp.]MDR4459240.1 hypothetical protein [Nitrospirales bacterium]